MFQLTCGFYDTGTWGATIATILECLGAQSCCDPMSVRNPSEIVGRQQRRGFREAWGLFPEGPVLPRWLGAGTLLFNAIACIDAAFGAAGFAGHPECDLVARASAAEFRLLSPQPGPPKPRPRADKKKGVDGCPSTPDFR